MLVELHEFISDFPDGVLLEFLELRTDKLFVLLFCLFHLLVRPLEFGPLPRQLAQHLLQILRHDLVLLFEFPPQQVVQNLYNLSCSLLILQVVMGQPIQVLPEEIPLYFKYVLLGLNRLLHALRQFEAKMVQKPDVLFVQTSPLFNFNCTSNQLWKFQVLGEDVVFPTSLTNFFVWIL